MSNMLQILNNRFEEIQVPAEYQKLWDDINYPIQSKKAAFYSLTEQERLDIFNRLSKRAFYLTTVAKNFDAKNIVEVGTAEGWQFFSFAEYCRKNNGKVWSCDISDKYDKHYMNTYSDVASFTLGTSKELAKQLETQNVEVDLFYIDGSHEKGAVFEDIINLKRFQNKNKMPIWIFDDFDERFGCYQDILQITKIAPQYMVYSPGKTASNNPTHQLIMRGRFT